MPNENEIPHGYAETMDCLNKPASWDVPGMIGDMCEHLRNDLEVPNGQLLAAMDWMQFRIKECREALAFADSELSAVAHGRPVDKEFSKSVSNSARALCDKLKGF